MPAKNEQKTTTLFMGTIVNIAASIFTQWRKLLYNNKRRTNKPVRFDFLGGHSIHLHPDGAIAELLYTSRFERREINSAIVALKKGMYVVDIGANIGLYSILADGIVGPKGKVWAFEPSTETCKKLERNLLLNACRVVETTQTALSDSGGQALALRRDPGTQDGDRYLTMEPAAGSASGNDGTDGGDSEAVPVTTLDIFMGSRGMPKVDFIKIDVEGGEFAILRGAEQVLRNNPNVILMFECTKEGCARYKHTQEDVYRFLAKIEFRVCCWNKQNGKWETDYVLLNQAGNLWACRDEKFFGS